jgi:hypothetical protein
VEVIILDALKRNDAIKTRYDAIKALRKHYSIPKCPILAGYPLTSIALVQSQN